MHVEEGFVEGCDGTRLFFRSVGSGPDMVACNGIGVSTFFWKKFEEHFSARFRFTTWDYRGHGRSDPPRDPARLDMESLADDLHEIAGRLGIHSGTVKVHIFRTSRRLRQQLEGLETPR